VVSHEQNQHDSHTLPEILRHVEASRGKAVKQAVCDRGYRGKREVNGTLESFYRGKRSSEIHATRKIKSANNAEGVQRLNLLSVT